MSSTTLQIRLDADLRHEADELFSAAGLDLSSAVRLFLRQSVIRRRLPFEVIGADPFYSEANMARLRKNIAEMEATGGTVHEVNLDD